MITGHPSRTFVAAIALFLIATSALQAAEVSRKWRDKSGKFEVEAKLIKQGDGKAQLLKNDGRAITVPITVLSEADQKYLKELTEAAPNPFAGGTPVPEPSSSSETRDPSAGVGLKLLTGDANPQELPTDGKAIMIDVDAPVPTLEADPVTALPKFREFAMSLEPLDAYGVTSDPILVDLEGPTFAVSLHRVGNAVSPAHFGRIHLVSGAAKRSDVVIDLEETLLLYDHHVKSGRSIAVLGVDSPSSRGGDIVLLGSLASGKPDAIARWRLPEWDKPGFKPKVEFARLLDHERAVVQVNSAVYISNLASGESLFKIDRIQAGAKIQLSGGGKYLAVPVNSGKGCRIVDTKSGDVIGAISFPTSLTPEVHFSPNGKQLALVAGNQYVIWDLEQATIATEATIDSPNGKFYGWAGDKYLLTQLGGLIDLELGMSLWKYGVPSNNQAYAMPGGVVAVNKLQGASLLSLPTPHPGVATVASVRREIVPF